MSQFIVIFFLVRLFFISILLCSVLDDSISFLIVLLPLLPEQVTTISLSPSTSQSSQKTQSSSTATLYPQKSEPSNQTAHTISASAAAYRSPSAQGKHPIYAYPSTARPIVCFPRPAPCS